MFGSIIQVDKQLPEERELWRPLARARLRPQTVRLHAHQINREPFHRPEEPGEEDDRHPPFDDLAPHDPGDVNFDPAQDPDRAGRGDRRARRAGAGRREPPGRRQPRLDRARTGHASTARAPVLERELKRYERRGASARNRFERQVRRTRTRFERQVRQRRSLVERTVKQNRRRFEREVQSVRKDLEKQSSQVGARVEKLVSEAQSLIKPVTTFPRPASGERRRAGRVRRPHNLAGGRSTLSSLNRRGVTQVAPRRS